MFKDKIVTKITNKINSKKFLGFIKRLQKHNTKLCIIVDNARWHLTKAVLEFIRGNGIKLLRLLAYSPELNPIEQYWQNVKKWLGTRIWFSVKELKKQLLAGFRKKEKMLKSYGY